MPQHATADAASSWHCQLAHIDGTLQVGELGTSNGGIQAVGIGELQGGLVHSLGRACTDRQAGRARGRRSGRSARQGRRSQVDSFAAFGLQQTLKELRTVPAT